MIEIRTYDDLLVQFNHPYRIGEYLLDSCGNIHSIPNDSDEQEKLIRILINDEMEVHYCINWESDSLYDINGNRIQSVYGIE